MTYNTNRTARKLRKQLGPQNQYKAGPWQWGYVAVTHYAHTTTLSSSCSAGDTVIETNGSLTPGALIVVGGDGGGPVEVGSVSGTGPYTITVAARGVPTSQSNGATVTVLSTVDVYLDGWQNAPDNLPTGVVPVLTTGVRFLSNYAPIPGQVVLIARGTGLQRSDRVVLGPLAGFSSQWIEPTLSGSWSNSGGSSQPCAYRKIGDEIKIRGVITGGSGTIFTLPPGYRPSATEGFSCILNLGVGLVNVTAAGVVSLASGTATSGLILGSIQFSTQ